jgi:SEP domain
MALIGFEITVNWCTFREIPKELRKKGEKIHVDFEDHRHENFVQPKRKFKAFIGSGNMLGR